MKPVPTPPTAATLRKYGMTEQDWWDMLNAQGGVCPCGRYPGNGRFNIDHEHVKGWKTMKPEDRKRHVRGLTCWTCNKFHLARGATAARLRALADYLEAYDGRSV